MPRPTAAPLTLLALAGLRAAAQETVPSDWMREKCARYSAAWAGALDRQGTAGLGAEFLARHAAFLASGCTAPADVCPRSEEEFALANIMIVRAMNAGAASTFPPFACRD